MVGGVSYVVRRRWLSLLGIAIALLAIPFYAAGHSNVGAAIVFAGATVIAVQVGITYVRNVRARSKGRLPTP